MESKEESKSWAGDSAKGEKGSGRVLMDDIHCLHWLEEVGMEQYHETFRTNFASGGEYLSRKRLAQVQLRHFPSMNITNFDHQKLLFKHITKVLEQEFVDQTKLAAARMKREREVLAKKEAQAKLDAERKDSLSKSVVGVVKKSDEKKSSRRKQRYSFEDKAWEIINKSRGEKAKGAYDHLKDSDEFHVDFLNKDKVQGGRARKPSVRRRSFEGGALNSAHDKAKFFGDMAMEFDTLQNKMIQMQSQYLNNIKDTVGCERINMLFLNDKSRELMFCNDSKWYRVPAESGIAGYAIVTGETLNIPVASNDYRFNASIDVATGVETRSILCQPIRGNRGGGRVIGVVELVNKLGGDGEGGEAFSAGDEDLLSSMTSQISEVLFLEFQELVNINESLSVFATPILPHTAEKRRNSGAQKGYELGTASSTNVSAQDKYKQLGGKKELIDSKFSLGGPHTSEKEKGRARVSRRKSFGEELEAEIKANPELLHVRKD